MALGKSISKFGLEFENGYHKIIRVNWDAMNNSAEIIVASFPSDALKGDLANAVDFKSYQFNQLVDPKNLQLNAIEAAYLKLKSLDEWSEASDV